MQHDDRALLRGQSLERDKQLLIGVRVMKRTLRQRPARKIGLSLEVPGGEAEGCAPDPAAHVSNCRASAQRLRKGLSDRVRGNVLGTREGVQGPPQAIAVLP